MPNQSTSTTAGRMLQAARQLRDEVNELDFSEPVTHVYNPLDYAWPMHEAYLRRFATGPRRVVFLGMNPGPFGMAQSGIPFGEIAAVRDWMKLAAPIGRPPKENPKRPVQGLDCSRSEVSGRRLWGLFAARHPRARDFFKDHFVVNYCPLAFMESSGRNRTPDKIPPAEMEPVNRACETHLRAVVDALRPAWLIGVGGFAARQAEALFAGSKLRIGTILHPSPASPAANRDWAGQATRQLVDLGVWF